VGLYESSRTRVAPFFEGLRSLDPSGRSWLVPLLALPNHGSRTERVVTPPIREGAWYPREAALPPPRALLHWLVDNVADPARRAGALAGALAPETRGPEDRRSQLLAGDPEAVREAHARIDQGPAARAWYVLEGASQPDALLLTDDAMVVVEGKRTEPGPTTSTTWLSGRHQMLRHLDAAWEMRAGRRLFGFFLVEGEGADSTQVPTLWQRAALDTLRPETLATSLPHRREAERTEIARAFIGVATWQAACAALDVAYATLPDRVVPSARVGETPV
jgi:hypothetical protein